VAVHRRGAPAPAGTTQETSRRRPLGGVGRPRQDAATPGIGSAAPARASSGSGGAASSEAWRVERGASGGWRRGCESGLGEGPRESGRVQRQRRGDEELSETTLVETQAGMGLQLQRGGWEGKKNKLSARICLGRNSLDPVRNTVSAQTRGRLIVTRRICLKGTPNGELQSFFLFGP
jgi:hypothetical protein